MIKAETSLLTEELDNAIAWYQQLNQEFQVSASILYQTRRFFSFTWDPLKTLEQNAPLALVEAAAKNDTVHLEQLLALPYVNNDAKYYALVAATQGGCTKAINVLLKLPNLEQIIIDGIQGSHTYFSVHERFKSFNYKKAQQMEGDISLYGRLGVVGYEPNLLIEAACHDRLDVIKHLQQFQFVKNMLSADSYGYYACLRAAEHGHLAVMNEFLKVKDLQEKIVNKEDALRFSATNGHVDVVDRLLEFGLSPTTNLRTLLTSAFQYGTVMVADRLLKVDAIDKFLNYSGNNPARIRDVEDVALYACYENSQKTADTAARIFNMLMKYPVVANFAEQNKIAGSGVVWETLQNIEKLSLNRQKAAAVSEPAAKSVEENVFQLRS